MSSPITATNAVSIVNASTTEAQMRSFDMPAARSAVSSPLAASAPMPINPPISPP